ncbi:MAG: phospholipase D family protein [Dehalococcoidia bacterium]|nr:phospholipase D family protein [Dehalococcoidia bacterium]
MLAPDNRALLLDALRPPPEYSLDRAVATTFTLDLETALTVPLAFAGFRFDENSDPIEIMEALRRMSDRLDIFCQAGAISAAEWPSDLVALLEKSIHEVKRPRAGRIFHPKVWALRSLDPSGDPSFRIVVLSRNLTASRSWDTVLWFDGRIRDRRPIANNAPLARFIAALPGLAVGESPIERRDALAELAEDLRRVHWELPDGAREVHFHPIGLPRARSFPIEEHFSGYRKLVISPFIREKFIDDVLVPARQGAILISRGEELDRLQPDTLEGLDIYELDPASQLSADDDGEEQNLTFLTNLHTKVFAIESARLAHLFVGSANATEGAFNGNVEFLCELVGPVAKFGVDALVGDDAPLRSMLTPYVVSDTREIDQPSTTGRALEGLLVDIAGRVGFRTAIAKQADGWVPRITTDAELPQIPVGTSVTIAAHNRPMETYELHPGAPIEIELSPREIADVTAFLQLTASRTEEGTVIQRSTVICSQLDGEPDDRHHEIFARQINTPEKFMRLLALLMGFASGNVAGNAPG